MLYEITIRGKTSKVDLSKRGTAADDFAPGSERFVARIDDSNHDIALIGTLKNNDFIVNVNGKVYSVKQFKSSSSSVTFLVGNNLITAETNGGGRNSFSFLQNSDPILSEISSVSNNVTSNFPAKVVKVNVRKGDHVKENETLLVLEAMKMEAQIKAPKACIVSEVYVNDGQMIERGKLMIKLDFE